MLGLIYTTLADMVEENYGLATWNRFVKAAEIPNCGAFTYGAVYPDEQMQRLLQVIEDDLQLPRADLLRAYGQYMFGAIKGTYKDLIQPYKSAKTFLLQIEDHIHQEVVKMHRHATMPMFAYRDEAPDTLTMLYHSQRQLCHVAEGMILGVGEHYHTDITIEHSTCLLKGDEQCTLGLTFRDNKQQHG